MVDRRVIIGVAVIGGGVAAYEIYKYEKNKSATAAAASTAAAAASTPYGYGASGYGYGIATSPYGYGAGGGFPAGYYGYGSPFPPGVGTTTAPVAATTNAQWDQAAIQQLQNDGYDVGTVTGALGAYLNGQQVSADQVNIVDAAIGLEGYPPVPAASGYPPNIKTGGTPGGGGGGGQTGGGGTGSTIAVPNVVGQRATPALNAIRAAGLTASTSPFRNPMFEYTVSSQSPAAGTQVQAGTHVTLSVTRS